MNILTLLTMRLTSILFLLIAINSYGQIPFTPVGGNLASMYAAGSQPQALEYADFNGDGKIDLAAANTNGNNVSILLGNNNGTFASAYSVTSINDPLDLVSADFNNDGKADLAVPSFTSGHIKVYLGSGTGTFTLAGTFTCGTMPREIVSEDFNADGKKDLAVINENTSKTTVLLGNGNGTFQTAVNYTTSTSPTNIIITDLNTDTKPDLVVIGVSNGTFYIHFGNGDGTFTASTITSIYPGSRIEAADLNQDGHKDLIHMTYSRYYIYINNGNGTFQAPVQRATHSGLKYGIEEIKTADVNNDAKADLVVLTSYNHNVAILLGNGDGTFQDELFFGLGNDSQSDIKVTDFNSDGKLDIATVWDAPSGVASISILMGNGDGTFASTRNFMPGSADLEYGNGIFQKDLNNDNNIDFIASDGFGVYTIFGNGDGTFQLPVLYPENYVNGFTIEDFNEDNYLDIAICYSDIGGISVLYGTSTGAFINKTTFTTAYASTSITSSDFNNDGNKDIVASRQGYSYILLGLGNGSFSTATQFSNGTYGLHHTHHADINNDGKEDFFLTASYGDGSSDNLVAMIGNGDGTFVSPVYHSVAPSNPFYIASEDFNKDGIDDIAVALAAGGGSIAVFISKGDGTFFPKVNYYAGASPVAIATDDFNGDGNIDLAVASWNAEKINILPGKSDGTFATVQQIRLLTKAVGIVTGDLNGDNKSDIVAIGGAVAAMINGSPTAVSASISQSGLCAGNTINIQYTTLGLFSGSNTFTAQLSDAIGSFTSPTNIAGPVTSAQSGSFSWSIPTNLTPGTQYRIKVIASDASVVMTDNGRDLSLSTALPVQPNDFILDDSSCLVSKNYTTNAVSGTTYQWSLSGGGTLTSTSNTATVVWNTAGGPYTLSCTPSNGCGTGPVRSGTITAIDVPAQPSTIIMPSYHCENNTENYSVGNDINATSYTWIVSSGWTGTSSTNTISITSTNVSGTIQVKANNQCGPGTARSAFLAAPSYVPVPVINASGNTLTASGTNVSFQWKKDGLDIGTNSSSLEVSDAGDYTVAVTSLMSGCESTSNIFVFEPTDTKSMTAESIRFYPNPTSGKIYLSKENQTEVEISIQNAWGNQVYTDIMKNNLNEAVIDLTSLSKGIYLLSLKSEGRIVHKQIILE